MDIPQQDHEKFVYILVVIVVNEKQIHAICKWFVHEILTRLIASLFSVGKISFIHLIVPLNFNIDQNAMRRISKYSSKVTLEMSHSYYYIFNLKFSG